MGKTCTHPYILCRAILTSVQVSLSLMLGCWSHHSHPEIWGSGIQADQQLHCQSKLNAIKKLVGCLIGPEHFYGWHRSKGFNYCPKESWC